MRNIAFLLLACIGTTAARAAEKPIERDEVVKVFAKLEKLNDELKTVDAKVTKEVVDEFMDEPLVSHGVFKYTKPSKLLIDIRKPKDLTLITLLDGHILKIYYPKSKRLEIIDLGKGKGKKKAKAAGDGKGRVADILQDLTFKLTDVEKKFTVAVFKEKAKKSAAKVEKKDADTKSIYRVEMTPRKDQKKLQGMFGKLVIWTDGERAWPQALQWNVPESEDSTKFNFSEVKQNTEIPDSAYVLKLPRGVKTVHYKK